MSPAFRVLESSPEGAAEVEGDIPGPVQWVHWTLQEAPVPSLGLEVPVKGWWVASSLHACPTSREVFSGGLLFRELFMESFLGGWGLSNMHLIQGKDKTCKVDT